MAQVLAAMGFESVEVSELEATETLMYGEPWW